VSRKKVSILNRAGNTRVSAIESASVVTEPLQERVRSRIKALVEEREVNHETLANYLGLSRSAVTRLLNDEGGIALQHIERLCEFFQISASELMAEPGALIQAITPIEAALVGIVRQMTELERRSLLTLLERPAYGQRDVTRSRMGRGMLTAKERELVDLFARVKRDGVREGILRTLRGAAQEGHDGPPAPQGKPRTTG
jgi:transcriptional regulator with XRE-family HTH domain